MATEPLIVIVGETASGKSSLAMMLAKKFDGEIICADSRTVYRGMDVGTAKPTLQQQAEIPHHLLDVVLPGEQYTVANFKQAAQQIINDIAARGKLPIMVGGSGLYIDAVLYDYSFSASSDERDSLNPRHKSSNVPQQKSPLRENTLIMGLRMGRDELEKRATQRVEGMLQAGLVDEARRYEQQHGWSAELETIYGPLPLLEDGSYTIDDYSRAIVQKHMNLAKRQRTWFKRNKSIHWLKNPEESVALVTTFLNKSL